MPLPFTNRQKEELLSLQCSNPELVDFVHEISNQLNIYLLPDPLVTSELIHILCKRMAGGVINIKDDMKLQLKRFNRIGALSDESLLTLEIKLETIKNISNQHPS